MQFLQNIFCKYLVSLDLEWQCSTNRYTVYVNVDFQSLYRVGTYLVIKLNIVRMHVCLMSG